MYNCQANSARFIYTISTSSAAANNHTTKDGTKDMCLLKNGFYFTKEARSDEKVRYTETDISCIVRTILFMYVFQVSTSDSLLDIINNGDVRYTFTEFKFVNVLTTDIAKRLLDSLFGDGFSFIIKRVLSKYLIEYNRIWRNYPYINSIQLPSASDYLKLVRFVNASQCQYSTATQFILSNSQDHKIPLQSNVKFLD